MVKIEKIEGSKIVLTAKIGIDSDKDDLKSVDVDLKVTFDLFELFSEVTKKELPAFLKDFFLKK